MSRYWRNSAVTSVALFLEACALYLAFVTISALIQAPETRLPFWLVLLALVWGFFLSYYVLTVNNVHTAIHPARHCLIFPAKRPYALDVGQVGVKVIRLKGAPYILPTRYVVGVF